MLSRCSLWLVLAVRGLGGSNAASCERADEMGSTWRLRSYADVIAA